MVYRNFHLFIIICFIFGIGKLLNVSSDKYSKLNLFHKIWSSALIAAMLLYYFLSTTIVTGFNAKNLVKIANLNDLFVNIFIILLNLLSGLNDYKKLNDILKNVFNQIKFTKTSQNIMCLRIYVFLSLPLIIFTIVIILEASYIGEPFLILLRVPTLLTILYVSVHLYLIMLMLQIINTILSDRLFFNNNNMVNAEETRKTKFVISLFKSDYKFKFATKPYKLHLKSLSKIYDNASTCIFYVEKLHGLQIVLVIWLTFSSAVVGVTLIACHQSNLPWLVILKSFLPFSWCFMACYIEDKLIKEVKQTETLVVKCLIDYRCDQTTRNILQTFNQLVTTNRLTFTAGNVFHLDYGLILGTIINVITYSIILIQLFQS